MLWKGLHGTETLLLVSRFSAGQGGSCCILHSPIEACPGPLHCMGLALRLAQGRWEDVDCWAGPRCPAFPPEAEGESLGPFSGNPPTPRAVPLAAGRGRAPSTGAGQGSMESHRAFPSHLGCAFELPVGFGTLCRFLHQPPE